MLDEFIRLILLILPAYAANAAPVVLGGRFPIDGGMRAWDKRPIFGSSKTWLGLLGGMAAGLLAAALEAHMLRGTAYDLWAGRPEWYAGMGLALSAGALAGDLAGSFIKRRLGLPAGRPSWLLDQLPFVLAALLAAWLAGASFAFSPMPLIFLLALTIVLHRAANAFAHASGLKKVPW